MNGFLNTVSDETRREIERINGEIDELQKNIQANDREARELMEREARGEGVFAARVFELKQKKMMLITEIQHRKVRINHLLLNP
ncbi:hypothetical protein AAU61_04385 [Desulfocarbo indianensis]|nr:hypothetical protein AAU61_04385 [Desulfocarbo indianensis]